jgi:hypothetical protein
MSDFTMKRIGCPQGVTEHLKQLDPCLSISLPICAHQLALK